MKRNHQGEAERGEQDVSLPCASLWQVPCEREQRHVCFVVFPGFQIMQLVGLVTVFQEATSVPSSGVDYRLHFMSDSGCSISSSCGFAIATESLSAIHGDTVLVMVGLPSMDATIDHPAIAAIANRDALKGRVTRIGGVFTRTSCYRSDKVDDGVWSSTGITAGVEIALAMVGEDNGVALSQAVARSLTVYRPGLGKQSHAAVLSDA